MLYEITDAVPHADQPSRSRGPTGRGTVSFAPFLAKGGVFSALRDPAYFVGEMRVLHGGIGLTWPNEVDFSADGWRRDAFPEEQTGECEDESISAAEKTAAVPRRPSP